MLFFVGGGLMFLPNFVNALGKIHQILLPGGKLAASVWYEPPRVPLISMPMSTARQYLQDPLLGRAVPGPFSLANVDALKKSIVKAGFTDIKSETITVTFEFDLAVENSIRTLLHIFVHYLLTRRKEEKRKYGRLLLTRQNYYLLTINQSGYIKLAIQAICIVGLKH
jgi:SAM-dependent methyltransferase